MSSVRLDAELTDRVRRVSRRQGLTASEVRRRALEEYCRRVLNEQHVSPFDDIIGVCEGDADLGANVSAISAEAVVLRHREATACDKTD